MVAVPETSVNEDYFPPGGKHQIGGPGKLADVEAEPVAEPVSQAAYGVLGFRVLAANSLHNGASFSCRELVCHSERLILLSNAACLPE